MFASFSRTALAKKSTSAAAASKKAATKKSKKAPVTTTALVTVAEKATDVGPRAMSEKLTKQIFKAGISLSSIANAESQIVGDIFRRAMSLGQITKMAKPLSHHFAARGGKMSDKAAAVRARANVKSASAAFRTAVQQMNADKKDNIRVASFLVSDAVKASEQEKKDTVFAARAFLSDTHKAAEQEKKDTVFAARTFLTEAANRKQQHAKDCVAVAKFVLSDAVKGTAKADLQGATIDRRASLKSFDAPAVVAGIVDDAIANFDFPPVGSQELEAAAPQAMEKVAAPVAAPVAPVAATVADDLYYDDMLLSQWAAESPAFERPLAPTASSIAAPPTPANIIMAEEAVSITTTVVAAPTTPTVITKKMKHQTPKQLHRAALDTWASESPAYGYEYRRHYQSAMPSLPMEAVAATTTTTEEVSEDQHITAATATATDFTTTTNSTAEQEEAVLLVALPTPTYAIATAVAAPAAQQQEAEIPASATIPGTSTITTTEADKNDDVFNLNFWMRA